MDSFFLPLMVHRRIYFLAKSEYFTGSGLKGGFQRWFFTAVGQIPIDRSGAEAAAGASAPPVVSWTRGVDGHVPEGTRSPDGRPTRARRVWRDRTRCRRTGDPGRDDQHPQAEPAWIDPAAAGQDRRESRWPLDFSRYDGLQGNRFIERAITDEIMYNLMELSGQQYVDIYAASLKTHRHNRLSPTVAATGAVPRCGVTRAMVLLRHGIHRDGTTIDLISVGVVGEDGREFYAVSTGIRPR